MKKNAAQTARDLVSMIDAYSIDSFTNCLTRLRIKLKSDKKVDIEKIKHYPYVLGAFIKDDQLQIILGPGFVDSVAAEMKKILDKIHGKPELDFISAAKVGENVKKARSENLHPIQRFFSKFSQIFSPLIIGFIGTGLLAGIAGILQASVGGKIENASAMVQSWNIFLKLFLEIWKSAFIIIIGWRTASIFGGSGVLGAICAALYAPLFANEIIKVFTVNQSDLSANFLGIHISNPLSNWLTVGFQPNIKSVSGQDTLVFGIASGNIFGALLAATSSLWIERGIKKILPNIVDVFLRPTIVLFLMLFINFLVLLPVSGYLFLAVSFFFNHLHANPFGAFFLATIFLITVSFGVHQGFLPIYAAIFATNKVNSLFPILAMGGFSQIGSAVALWIRAQKNSLLRKQIEGAILPAFFGIGEPLIYGVTLPRIKPFITSCLGAGFGGFFIGAIIYWGNIIFGLNSKLGPSNLLATIMMTTPDNNVGLAVCLYLISGVIAVVFGLLITLFCYSRIANAGLAHTKNWWKNAFTKPFVKKIASLTALFLIYLSVIGLFIYWLSYYYSLPKLRREQWKLIKVE